MNVALPITFVSLARLFCHRLLLYSCCGTSLCCGLLPAIMLHCPHEPSDTLKGELGGSCCHCGGPAGGSPSLPTHHIFGSDCRRLPAPVNLTQVFASHALKQPGLKRRQTGKPPSYWAPACPRQRLPSVSDIVGLLTLGAISKSSERVSGSVPLT